MMTGEPLERDPFDVLAEEYTARLRRGEDPPIAEYAERHPDLAERIQELFPTIAEVERLKRRKETSAKGIAPESGPPPERLGDFRILREIGRGGMGVVYEAEQESLGRRVAIKVLPRSLLPDSKSAQRFEREARTVARLHHTNIVPVFGIGREDGHQYFVMQYIDGVGVDEVIDELRRIVAGEAAGERSEEEARAAPDRALRASRIARALVQGRLEEEATIESAPSLEETPAARADSGPSGGLTASPSDPTAKIHLPARGMSEGREPAAASLLETPPVREGRLLPSYFRSVAKIGLQAANALHYAHTQGTLHRDIKPANLLLDARGFVWVTDFGLAKALDEHAISRTGDVVGTLRYMAPEQLSGRACVASDIYALGLTLYELLVLRPAFPASDTKKILSDITEGRFESPRKLRPEIPRDLETIVLKAAAREPEQRYATAGDFAEDLRRFLEDLPIRARPVTPIGRLWRWAKRNRALAAATGSTVALLILLTVVASVGYLQTTRAMQGELRQRKRAEANSEIAVKALDKIFDQLAPRRTLVSSSLNLSAAGRLVEDSSDEDESPEAGASRQSSSELEVPLQPVLSREVAALLENLLHFYGQLAEQEGEDPKLRRKIADANRRVGDIRQRLGYPEEARAAYERSLALFKALRDASPDDEELRTEVARIHNELGILARARGEPAQNFHETALEALEPGALAGLLAESPWSAPAASANLRFELARTYLLLARGPGPGFPGGKPSGPGSPKEPAPGEKGERRGGRGRPGRGEWGRWFRVREECLERAVSILETLLAENPGAPDCQQLLARAYRELSYAPSFAGKTPSEPGQTPASTLPRGPEARARAAEILEKLVQDFPDAPDYRYDLSELYADAAGPPPRDPSAFETWRKGALASLRKATEIAEALAAEHPQVPDYAALEVRCRSQLAGLLQGRDWPPGSPEEVEPALLDEAETQLRKALALQSSLVRKFPEVSSYELARWGLGGFLARLLERRGRLEEARDTFRESVTALERLASAAEEPARMPARFLLGDHLKGLEGVLRRLGDSAGAEEAHRKAESLGLFKKPRWPEEKGPPEPGGPPERKGPPDFGGPPEPKGPPGEPVRP